MNRPPSYADPASARAENHLIELLNRSDRHHLLQMCDTAPLVMGDVLCEPGQDLRHVHFPVEGFISLVTHREDGPGLEVGMVGREGMLGADAVLGSGTTSLKGLVQGPGSSRRLTMQAFRLEMARSMALRQVMQRFASVLMTQFAESAACMRFHQIGPRLARWLLMSHDRAHDDTFQVTHEFLGYMLGVRRVGITAAAGELQRLGVIDYHRGEVTVTHRAGLEAAACSCYTSAVQAYAAQLA
jgi:CRP-like cAMP-binding protein